MHITVTLKLSLGQEGFNINAEMICTKQFTLNNPLQNSLLFKCIIPLLSRIIKTVSSKLY